MLSINQELISPMNKGIATMLSFKIQGAQTKVISIKARAVRDIPALKASSLSLEPIYKAIAVIDRVTKESTSI